MVSQCDVLDAIPYALKAMDQPTIDGLNSYLIARQTRAAGIKVAHSGRGGDELFAGYSSYRDVPRTERFARFWRHWPSILRRPLAHIFAALAPGTDQNRKLAELVGAREGAIHLRPGRLTDVGGFVRFAGSLLARPPHFTHA
jgi:asparagine synthase (glutamine-hydrolysing)